MFQKRILYTKTQYITFIGQFIEKYQDKKEKSISFQNNSRLFADEKIPHTTEMPIELPF